MDNNISKAEFLRNCFKEMLDDGKPHRYRELLEFARQQIQGTRFDEKIQPNLFIQYVNSVIKKPDSNYERVQFGIRKNLRKNSWRSKRITNWIGSTPCWTVAVP